MTETFEALAAVLREEAEALQTLLVLAHLENEALVLSDHEALQASLRQQDELAGQLARLDRDWTRAALTLSEAAGLPPNAALLAICERLPAERAEEGRALHDEIHKLASELATLNRENDVLIRQALHQTQHSIALLTGIARQDEHKETYGPAPHGGRRRDSSVLDRLA